MPISVYNSLSRKKEEFAPLNPPHVNIYTCGVTVYDECHIGHARSLYIFEVIRRYLEYRGFKVNFARNITDIDDKIINRAKELKISWQDLVKKYIDRYDEDLRALGIAKADYEPRATQNLESMLEYIQALIEKGYAYVTATGVYFSVRKFKDYGKLSGQGIDQMLKGVRKEPDETKEDPLDFALWKVSQADEPGWESPYGRGRPGWHIECSVMAQKFLKTDTLDIHAGGRDLIFPHHENEIAQAEALTGKPFANYWIHHGLLTINAQKMSKSLGNFVTIKDFIAKYKDIGILKLFFLSVHYAHPIDYNEEKMEEAKKALERIVILKDKLLAREALNMLREAKGEKLSHELGRFTEIKELKDKFLEQMDDDFNTPEALATFFDLITLTNKNIDNLDFAHCAWPVLSEMLGIFGINFRDLGIKQKLSNEEKWEMEEKIFERDRARKNKDYALADKIKKELEKKGIILEDGKSGTEWRLKL